MCIVISKFEIEQTEQICFSIRLFSRPENVFVLISNVQLRFILFNNASGQMTELFGKIPSFKVKVSLFFSFGRIYRGQRVKYHTE